jgi:hypothetical protein
MIDSLKTLIDSCGQVCSSEAELARVLGVTRQRLSARVVACLRRWLRPGMTSDRIARVRSNRPDATLTTWAAMRGPTLATSCDSML